MIARVARCALPLAILCALAAVVEMARWQDLRHALPAFILAGRLAGLDEAEIAIKTADTNDLAQPENQHLLSSSNRVRVIITKHALQEGWDCPFAYILVSLNNTASQQSMTQLVGRVLRQPGPARTPPGDAPRSPVRSSRPGPSTGAARRRSRRCGRPCPDRGRAGSRGSASALSASRYRSATFEPAYRPATPSAIAAWR